MAPAMGLVTGGDVMGSEGTAWAALAREADERERFAAADARATRRLVREQLAWARASIVRRENRLKREREKAREGE